MLRIQRLRVVTATSLCLGLIPASSSGENPPEAAAEDETTAGKHVLESRVHFEFDSAELSSEARAALARAAEWIKRNETGLILIEGHADRVGDEPYNKDLAARRAESARAYLLAQGVSGAQIRVLSYGEGLPATDTEDRSRFNRRIVLMAVQKEPIIETTTKPVERKVFVDRVVEVPTPVPARPLRLYGIDVMAGGGVSGFLDDHTRDVTDIGGLWSARLVGGGDRLFGFEAAYVGTAQDVDALGVDSNAVVMGNGVEGNLRLNLIRGAMLRPYVFGGLGWTHYALTNTDVNTSSIDDSDDVLHIPVGAGIGMRLSRRMVLDVRATLRGAAGDGMFDGGAETDDGMETLSSSAQIGFAF